jgi:radical SAM protein with 4Fe4S-binding SPASM domain
LGLKTFNLDKGLNLPSNINSVKREEGYLYVAKFNPSFILLSELESKIFEELMEGKSIRDSTKLTFDRTNVEARVLEQTVSQLLEKIEISGFYEGISNAQEKTWPLHLYVTDYCNLRCKTCYKNAGERKPDELTTDEILSFIDAFSVQGPSRVVMSGGEPLSRKDFFEIAEHIKNRSHKLSVVSNGLLIESREQAVRISELVDFFQISLDGATQKFNDYYRGEGTYNEILKKINLFKGLDFTLNVGMVVSGYNVEDIEHNFGRLMDLLENKKIKINVSNLMDYGRGKCCEEKGTVNMVYGVLDAAKDAGMLIKKWEPLNIKTYDCGFARSITVDSDGRVYYCPVANSQAASGLNIRVDSFSDIVNHFKEFNRSISVENIDECCDCSLEYLCGGGCRIDNKAKRGSYLKPENCDGSRREMIYQEMVRVLT